MNRTIKLFFLTFILTVSCNSHSTNDPTEEIKRLSLEIEGFFNKEQYQEAAIPAQKAIELAEKHVDENPLVLINSLQGLAQINYKMNKFEDTKALLVRALKISEAKLGNGYPSAMRLNAMLYSICMDQGKTDMAKPFMEQAKKIQENMKEIYMSFEVGSPKNSFIGGKYMNESSGATNEFTNGKFKENGEVIGRYFGDQNDIYIYIEMGHVKALGKGRIIGDLIYSDFPTLGISKLTKISAEKKPSDMDNKNNDSAQKKQEKN